jgi:acyl carrier protein phosphodiesterase
MNALKELQHIASSLPRTAASIRVIAADLAEPTSLDAIPPESQAGVLFGNVLHYFADPLPLLRAARTKLVFVIQKSRVAPRARMRPRC